MAYRRLNNEYPSYMYSRANSDDSFTREQFESPPRKIPYRAIIFATVLFTIGGFLIGLSGLYLSGHIEIHKDDTFWPMMVLGLLMFIPGFYTVRIAVYSYLGYPGFSYDAIPEVQ